MGGSMKGGHGHMHSINSSSRRKWSSTYVVMAIVCSVLGCGILGLMGIHRLRERRALNLLIKDKDHQILSLHLLLQKEREHAAEAKRNAEEMKTSLGSQKAELTGKMSEMESMISSLREEQRAVESAFQEKQREANLMREKYAEISEQSLQVEALEEKLHRKEGEIEELKLRLQLGSNATATATEAKAVIDTSSGNGGTANAGGGEVEATGEKGLEHEKAGEDQESEGQGSPRRFRGHLKRAKGRRWRLIGKQRQGKRNDALGNTSAESTPGEPGKSSETKMDAQESEQMGEVISIAKPTEEKRDTDVSGRKGGGEEENGDQDEESEDREETNEPQF